MWGNPTSLPMKINLDLKRRNRKCYKDNSTCIVMGINADLYENNSSEVYYVELT